MVAGRGRLGGRIGGGERTGVTSRVILVSSGRGRRVLSVEGNILMKAPCSWIELRVLFFKVLWGQIVVSAYNKPDVFLIFPIIMILSVFNMLFPMYFKREERVSLLQM